MKRLLTVFLLIVYPLARGQNPPPDNIIVLVDVSASIKKIGLADTIPRNVMLSLLHRDGIVNPSFSFVPDSERLDYVWSQKGKKILLIPYGDLETDKRVRGSVSPYVFEEKEGDWEKAIKTKWPGTFVDKFSYQELAKWRAAALARKNGFKSYWLFIVGDGIREEKGASALDPEQERIGQDYQIDEERGIGKIVYANKDFKINVNYVVLKDLPNQRPQSEPCQETTLRIAQKSDADKTVPSGKPIFLSWKYSCPTSTTFTVYVSGLEGAKVKEDLKIQETTGNSITLPLEDGAYKITVEANGNVQDSIQLKVGSFHYGWLLLMAILSIGAYFAWKFFRPRKRPKKLPEKPIHPSDKSDNWNKDDEL